MLVTPPLMHVSAHWAAFQTLFGGGKVVMTAAGSFDPAVAWDLIESEQVNIAVIVGNAMAAPLIDRYARAPRRRVVDDGLRVRRRGAVAGGEAAHAGGPPERDGDGRLRVDRDRRGRHRRRRRGGRQGHRRGVHDGRQHGGARRAAPADRARQRRDRQAGPPRPHPDRLLQGRREDGGHLRRGGRRALGAARATSPAWRRTARSACTAGGRRASTPAARRSSPRRSSRR